MKKRMALILSVVLSVSLFAGCSQGQQTLPEASAESLASSEDSQSPEAAASGEASENASAEEAGGQGGTLIVGLDDTFAPMGYRDEAGNLIGFDIDLANAVGEQMGWEIVFQPISWSAKEMEIAAKNIDCIWNGMSRTDEREAMWTLSQNYLNNKIIVMSNPDVTVTDKSQLKDYQLGTQAKSSALEMIQADEELYAEIQGNLHEYETYDDIIMDMQAGRVDIMLVDEVLGKYKNDNLETKLNVASFDLGDDFYCIGFRKEDTELCGKVEEAIKAVIASGKGEEISNKWFGENLLLELN